MVLMSRQQRSGVASVSPGGFHAPPLDASPRAPLSPPSAPRCIINTSGWGGGARLHRRLSEDGTRSRYCLIRAHLAGSLMLSQGLAPPTPPKVPRCIMHAPCQHQGGSVTFTLHETRAARGVDLLEPVDAPRRVLLWIRPERRTGNVTCR